MTDQDAPTRTFTIADQQAFAALTGDVNPMHVDPVAARRLLTGLPVVHGVHTLLAGLESLGARALAAAWRIECDFPNPISVGDAVHFHSTGIEGGLQLRASVNGLDCTRVTLPEAAPAGATVCSEPSPAEAASRPYDRLERPVERAAADWVGEQQELALPEADFSVAFPLASARWGERRIAALGLLSYYVGMVCPGLHSVFSAIEAEPGGSDGPLRFRVRRHDPRFSLLIVDFEGPWRGSLKAFVRPEMQQQPASATLLPLLHRDEFAGRHAWVIGGSRGLGELAAKLVAAGGGSVTLTHAAGASDAARVVDEIRRSGRGAAVPCPLDIVHADLPAWVAQARPPDAVFFFATPRIFRKKASSFDAAAFDEFVKFYIRRFERLCDALERAGRPVTVFVPSTVYIDERPKGMAEYAMAKAAAEVLCADLQRASRQLRLLCPRLPRMATDQTTSLVAVKTDPALDVLLPLVREAMAAPSQG